MELTISEYDTDRMDLETIIALLRHIEAKSDCHGNCESPQTHRRCSCCTAKRALSLATDMLRTELWELLHG